MRILTRTLMRTLTYMRYCRYVGADGLTDDGVTLHSGCALSPGSKKFITTVRQGIPGPSCTRTRPSVSTYPAHRAHIIRPSVPTYPASNSRLTTEAVDGTGSSACHAFTIVCRRRARPAACACGADVVP